MMGTVLIFGETDTGDLASGFWEQIAVGRQLCEQTGWTMIVVVVGYETGPAELVARSSGATRIFVVDDVRLGEPWPEAATEVLAKVSNELSPDAIVMPRSLMGSEISARLAFRLGVGMAMDVMSMEQDEDGLMVTRPVFGGAATARLRLSGRPWIVVPRKGAFAPAEPVAAPSAESVPFPSGLDSLTLKTTPISRERREGVGKDLEQARVIVAGGLGMGGSEPFQLLRTVADRLDGALAASRPPCDAGWVEPMLQVGLTGKTVAPDLYLAVGISGATQHMTGCSSSRVIVAINNDPDAPIFRMASYGVVGDWQEVLPGLLEGLSELSDSPTTSHNSSPRAV
jgi:electron transfer flavoprotein alpha subunit